MLTHTYDAQSNRDLRRESRTVPHIGQHGQPHGSGLSMRHCPVECTKAWLLDNKCLALHYGRLGFFVEGRLQATCMLLVAPRPTREF